MSKDPRDDLGLPYDPDTPEGFLEMMRHHFETWWENLEVPGSFQGVSLEKDTARATWRATEEFFWDRLRIVYDSMSATKEVWEQKTMEEAGFIVSKLGSNSCSFTVEEFVAWMDHHGKHIRREYDDGVITITFAPKSSTSKDS